MSSTENTEKPVEEVKAEEPAKEVSNYRLRALCVGTCDVAIRFVHLLASASGSSYASLRRILVLW
jgi:hypothetical protein